MTQFNNVLFDNDLAEQIDNIITYTDPSELLYVPFYVTNNDGTTVWCRN
jgi:hypothetical protein